MKDKASGYICDYMELSVPLGEGMSRFSWKIINVDSSYNFFSKLLIEAAKLLLIPRGRAASQSPRETPRKPASVQQILYAIGGMSRREKLKSGERYDPKEGKWKPIGMFRIITIIS